MKIGIILHEDEKMNDDVNNFTLASAIFKECQTLPQLNARVVAEMILLQCHEEERRNAVIPNEYGYSE